MKILIETMSRVTKTGIAKQSGNRYIMVEAFLHAEDMKYPQLFEYYASSEQEILPAGFYEVPVKVSIRDGRLSFFPEIQQGKRVNTPTKTASA